MDRVWTLAELIVVSVTCDHGSAEAVAIESVDDTHVEVDISSGCSWKSIRSDHAD